MTTSLDMATARARAESLMTSTCTVRTRGSGASTTDPTTGVVSVPLGATVYSGPCRVRPATTQDTRSDAGAAVVFGLGYVFSVPFAVTNVSEGDVVTVDSSPDPALVGIVVEVQKVDRGEQITARRLFCKDVA